jgi:hypothetical protein
MNWICFICDLPGGASTPSTEKTFLEIVELFKKDKHYPPIIDVKIDAELLFVLLHNENETGETLVDIFNTKTGNFIRYA